MKSLSKYKKYKLKSFKFVMSELMKIRTMKKKGDECKTKKVEQMN